MKSFIVAALRLAGVVVDDETLTRVLPLAETALADGPVLRRAAPATVEPCAHPAAVAPGGPAASRGAARP